ncbi:MAG TPA: hypothetical protein VF277_08060 [Steroidobacteraceae bacterium]
MTRTHADAGRIALIALLGSLVLAGRSAADAPEATSATQVAPAATAAATVDPSPAATATPRARDHLLELVVEYLAVAFARDAHDARTAQLEPPPVVIAQ